MVLHRSFRRCGVWRRAAGRHQAAPLWNFQGAGLFRSWIDLRGLGEMRIAQVAPLYESCPPQLYGGTERVVSYLTEELVRLGHDVTLFASGDSR
jgi:hypothetical protein